MYTASSPSPKRRLVYDLLHRVRTRHSTSTASVEWDVTDLLARIEQLRAEGVRVNLAAVLTKATANTVRAFPLFNTRVFWTWRGPREVRFHEVSCNLVVHRKDGDEDLLFPAVLRGVDELSVLEIAEKIRGYKQASLDEIEEVQALRKLPSIPRVLLKLHDNKILSDPDYFIARYGTYGLSAMVHWNSGVVSLSTASPSTTFYPLGLQQRPWVVDGSIVPRTIMTFGLGIDHQVMDGLDGLKGMQHLQQQLESPALLLGHL